MITLDGKKGLVTGIANRKSIAFGCARAMREHGAELAITYVDRQAQRFVTPLGEELGSRIVLPCNVSVPGQMEGVFERIANDWGRLDFLLHAIAWAPREDLHGRVIDCSRDGFLTAMDVSCHSFIRMARLAEPLMEGGGCLMTVTFYGSEKVVEHYNLMGPVKAALEATVRYLAAELGPKNIRVHAVSPGPIETTTATGIEHFDALLDRAARRAPQHHLVSIQDVGQVAAFLASDAASGITGNVTYVDAGFHVVS